MDLIGIQLLDVVRTIGGVDRVPIGTQDLDIVSRIIRIAVQDRFGIRERDDAFLIINHRTVLQVRT